MNITTTTKEIPEKRRPNLFPRAKSGLVTVIEAMETGKCLEVRFSEAELNEKSAKKRYDAAYQTTKRIQKQTGRTFRVVLQPTYGFDVFRLS